MDCCCNSSCSSADCNGAVTPETCTTAQSVAGGAGVVNEVLADSIGVLWRGVSGTVDPWTKAELAADQNASVSHAAGCASVSCCIKGCGCKDVTSTLKLSNSDPSQFWCGVQASLKKLDPTQPGGIVNDLIWIAVLAIVAIVLFNFTVSRLERGK